MWSEITESLLETLRADTALSGLATRLELEVTAGQLAPTVAARQIIEAFRDPS